MIYHSTDWGFDFDYVNKKNKSFDYLNRIGFKTCQIGIFSFADIKENRYIICGYKLAIVTSKLMKKGYFNITSNSQLIKLIIDDFINDLDISIVLVDQIFKCKDCFTATVMSDGKGKLVCEYVKETVDNRKITSGEYASNIGRLEYKQWEPIWVEEYAIFEKIVGVLNDCLYFAGYYEFTYGVIDNKKDFYFTYYSNEVMYLNYFKHEHNMFDDNYYTSRIYNLLII